MVIIAVLLAIGVLFYDIDLPSGGPLADLRVGDRARVGVLHPAGHLAVSLAKNGRSASAVVTPFALLMQFISGVFFQFSELPTWMQTAPRLFPLKWMAPGHALGVPARLDGGTGASPGSWELGRGRARARPLVRRRALGALVVVTTRFAPWDKAGARSSADGTSAGAAR